MRIEEARAALVVSLRECRSYERYRKKHNKDGPCTSCLKAADAYALAAHVDACEMKEWFAPGPDSGAWHDCGDGWYCDGARELGR